MFRHFCAAAVLALSGCSSAGAPSSVNAGAAADKSSKEFAREECKDADWFQVGERDGLYGEGPAKFEERQSKCAVFGVTINSQDYADGRARGLRTYCRPDRAFDAGRNGRDYVGVCPADVEAAFLAEYEVGRKLFDLSTAASSAKEGIEKASLKLETNKFELSRAIDHVGDGALSGEARNAAASDVARLRRENEALETEIASLQQKISDADAALSAHRAFLEERAAKKAGAGAKPSKPH